MLYDNIISRTMAVSILNKWTSELITEADLDKCKFTEEEYGKVVTNSINKLQDVLIENNYEVTEGELYGIVCTELINPIKDNTVVEKFDTKNDLLEYLEDLAYKHGLDLSYSGDGSYDIVVTHWLMQDEFIPVNIVVNEGEDFYTVSTPDSQYFWFPITKDNLEMFLTQDPINKGENA
ncbi:hypothetical protein FMLHJGGC_00105 [Staphylococcus phage BSwM-KMM1]|nr:hypothetical protein FMLHJGGC_00105 [Pseudomonas phage BSwM KMM1]